MALRWDEILQRVVDGFNECFKKLDDGSQRAQLALIDASLLEERLGDIEAMMALYRTHLSAQRAPEKGPTIGIGSASSSPRVDALRFEKAALQRKMQEQEQQVSEVLKELERSLLHSAELESENALLQNRVRHLANNSEARSSNMLKAFVQQEQLKAERMQRQMSQLLAEHGGYRENISKLEVCWAAAEEALAESRLSLKHRSDQLDVATSQCRALEFERERAVEKMVTMTALCQQMHAKINSVQGNVRVFCRIVPTNAHVSSSNLPLSADAYSRAPVAWGEGEGRSERAANSGQSGQERDENAERGRDGDEEEGERTHIQLPHHSRNVLHLQGKVFQFDRIFTQPSRVGDELFDEIAPAVRASIYGQKVCVLLYGHSESCKAHTLTGRYSFVPSTVASASNPSLPSFLQELDHREKRVDGGVLFRTFEELQQFAETESAGSNYSYQIRLSLCMLYCDELHDLLGSVSELDAQIKKMKMNNARFGLATAAVAGLPSGHAHSNSSSEIGGLRMFVRGKQLCVDGLSKHVLHSIEDLKLLMRRRDEQLRNQNYVYGHDISSRAHLIYSLEVHRVTLTRSLLDDKLKRIGRSPGKPDGTSVHPGIYSSTSGGAHEDGQEPDAAGLNTSESEERRGFIHFVELAGSERQTSHTISRQLLEDQAIAADLSALSDVLAALKSRQNHVPYRNSKLTYYLQEALRWETALIASNTTNSSNLSSSNFGNESKTEQPRGLFGKPGHDATGFSCIVHLVAHVNAAPVFNEDTLATLSYATKHLQ